MAKKATNGHGKNRGVLRLYRSYNYVDKDPAIDKLRTVMQDEHLDEKKLAMLSGVGYSTIDNWTKGKTRRPQHTTLAAAAAAMGFDWNLNRAKMMNYEEEYPKAQRWHAKRAAERTHQQKSK